MSKGTFLYIKDYSRSRYNHCIHNQLLLNNLQVISQKYGRNL